MKRLAGLSALAVIISSTSGCGWLWGPEGYFRDRGSDYLEAQQTAPMQLPPGVQTDKRLVPLLPIPSNVPDDNVKGEFEVPRPQPLVATTSASDFSLQKSGDSRWLMAQRSPSEVWPLALQFFQDNGFRIDEQRPQTGEFTTTWQGASELSSSMVRHLGSSGLAADSETRLRVRIEPGVQRNTSEIYVVSANRPAGSTANVDFTNRSVNAGLDAALVNEMLVSMSRSADKGGTVSLLAARDFDTPTRVTLNEDGCGNPVLTLNEDLDRAWSSVGRALEQGEWRVEDINRPSGLSYLNLAE